MSQGGIGNSTRPVGILIVEKVFHRGVCERHRKQANLKSAQAAPDMALALMAAISSWIDSIFSLFSG